jgi:hypothetical protein
LQEYCSSQDLQYQTLSKDLENWYSRKSSEIRKNPRHGRHGYRQLEKIVKTERRAPLVKITANFNEEKNDSVSKQVGMVYVEYSVPME